MSTNKTQKYQLHAWEPGDHFLREEFNENFSLLDEKAVQVLFGTYQGDGRSEREISLGLTPLAMLVSDSNGVFDTSYSYHGGLTLRGHPSIMAETRRLLEIVEGGFKVYTDNGGSPSCTSNNKILRYYYLVFF